MESGSELDLTCLEKDYKPPDPKAASATKTEPTASAEKKAPVATPPKKEEKPVSAEEEKAPKAEEMEEGEGIAEKTWVLFIWDYIYA